jgi:tetratricopeptide (TPR) repeat protein
MVAVAAACLLSVPNVLAGQNSDSAERGCSRPANSRKPRPFSSRVQDERGDAAAAFYLGRIAMEERDHDRASDYFETATKLEPKNSTYFLWLGRAYGREAQNANVLRQPGLANKARGAWEHAIELDANNLDARSDLIRYYVQAPGLLGGSMTKALEQAEEIRKRNALRGYLELGALYERDKKFAEAETAYLGAAKEKSDRHVGEYRLGVFYQNTGAYDKAFELFESMIAANPNESGALFQIGKTRIRGASDAGRLSTGGVPANDAGS